MSNEIDRNASAQRRTSKLLAAMARLLGKDEKAAR